MSAAVEQGIVPIVSSAVAGLVVFRNPISGILIFGGTQYIVQKLNPMFDHLEQGIFYFIGIKVIRFVLPLFLIATISITAFNKPLSFFQVVILYASPLFTAIFEHVRGK